MTEQTSSERSDLPFAVGLCPEPTHADEFYMPLTEHDVETRGMQSCPLDCPHELVVYRRDSRS